MDVDDDEMWVCKIGAAASGTTTATPWTTFDTRDNPQRRHITRRHGVAGVGSKVYYKLSGNELGVITFDPALESWSSTASTSTLLE